jgi:hypothetical protein
MTAADNERRKKKKKKKKSVGVGLFGEGVCRKYLGRSALR